MRFVKMVLPNSLRLKVLLAYVAGMMLSITLLVLTAVVMLQSDALNRMDLSDAIHDLGENIAFDSNGSPVGFDDSLDKLTWLYDGPQRETAYRILDEAGKTVVVSSAGEDFWPADRGLAHGGTGIFDFEHDGIIMYGTTEPVEHDGRTWYLQFAASERFMDLIHHIAFPLVWYGMTAFGLVTFVAFGLCAYITLRYTLKPLGDVSDSAAAISPRSLHARLQTGGIPTEIAPLVDSFNRVLRRLENAVQHAPRGSEVLVEVDTTMVSVRDWGPGVTHEQLPQIFSRFWRGAHRRDHGAGLGLTICQEIAVAHGWTLSAHNADPGLRLRLSLPTTEVPKSP